MFLVPTGVAPSSSPVKTPVIEFPVTRENTGKFHLLTPDCGNAEGNNSNFPMTYMEIP
jgi:hypothetical protein